MAQKAPKAYELFDGEGKRAKYKRLLRAAEKADVIVFGESHNDALGHWLQNVLYRDVDGLDGRPLLLGLEMFEVDQQAALNEYLDGRIEAKDLNEVGEGLWNNFATDYEPLIRHVHSAGSEVIATNVPRKHARAVFRQGFEGLPDELQGLEFAPTPILYDPEQKAYREMLEMMGGGHGGANFPKAQAIKDITMAWRIGEALPAGGRLLHLNGSFHSDFRQGIVWYLGQLYPKLRVLTVSVVEQTDVGELLPEHENRADFIFAVPSLMTKTY